MKRIQAGHSQPQAVFQEPTGEVPLTRHAAECWRHVSHPFYALYRGPLAQCTGKNE